jgi:hypothetical protein
MGAWCSKNPEQGADTFSLEFSGAAKEDDLNEVLF